MESPVGLEQSIFESPVSQLEKAGISKLLDTFPCPEDGSVLAEGYAR